MGQIPPNFHMLAKSPKYMHGIPYFGMSNISHPKIRTCNKKLLVTTVEFGVFFSLDYAIATTGVKLSFPLFLLVKSPFLAKIDESNKQRYQNSSIINFKTITIE